MPMMRRARSRSLSEFDFTSTIRLPYVLPARTIAAVVSMLSTILVAVPAFSRVDPAITSGPTVSTMATSARSFSSDRGSQVMPMMRRFAARAARDGAPHERRDAARGNANDDILARRAGGRASRARPRR